MAGPDTKLSQLPQTTDPTNGRLYMTKPDGGGGWDDHYIEHGDLVETSDFVTDSEVNQNSDYNFALDAGVKLENIDFEWQASSPLIKIGTTPGGTEISLAELSVPNNDYLVVNIDKIMTATTTIYISISGGTVNFKITYRTNYF